MQHLLCLDLPTVSLVPLLYFKFWVIPTLRVQKVKRFYRSLFIPALIQRSGLENIFVAYPNLGPGVQGPFGYR